VLEVFIFFNGPKSPDFEECFLKLSDLQGRLQHVAKIQHNSYDGDFSHLYGNVVYQIFGPKQKL
jgi:hypothetical protein